MERYAESSCSTGCNNTCSVDICGYADLLLQRSGPGDHSMAMSLLDEALTISSELGMRPQMERVLTRWAILRA